VLTNLLLAQAFLQMLDYFSP